jgi:HAD superfamily hydrolase (TIGR01490 family)
MASLLEARGHHRDNALVLTPNSPTAAAFFDLDLTLLSVNSGALWIRSEHRKGRITTWQFMQGTVYLLGYRFSVVDMDKVMLKALGTVKGVLEQDVCDRTTEWYHREVARHAAPGAWPVLDRHRDAGDRLVLLTSSSPYESAAASEQFSMDAFLSTSYQVVDGRFTGYPEWPICYGAGKVAHAERYAAEHGIDLGASYFYTDSFSDVPMLERVGNPRVVHPDPRLKRLARQRGWTVLDWKSR